MSLPPKSYAKPAKPVIHSTTGSAWRDERVETRSADVQTEVEDVQVAGRVERRQGVRIPLRATAELIRTPSGTRRPRTGVAVELQRQERDRHVLDFESPDEVLEVDEHHLVAVHHHVARLNVAVQEMRRVGRIAPEVVEGLLGTGDRIVEHRSVRGSQILEPEAARK